MTLLALDTACAACSVAVLRDGDIVAHRFEPMARGHAEALLPMVVATLADGGADFDQVERIAVTVGPGSFTGIRTGVAAARGLALACGVPAIAVTTLEAVAWTARREDGNSARRLLAVLETRRADLYCQLFAPDLSPLSQPAALRPEAVSRLVAGGPVRIAGDGAESLRPFVDAGGGRVEFAPPPGAPDAAAVALFADSRPSPPPGTPPPTPLYLHPPEATIPRAGGRMRP